MKIISLLTFLFLCPMSEALMIINGTTSIVILENSYSFTNFEWAKGAVQFKQGFSVASTTTVLLDVIYPIEGTINVNNGGTLILNGVLHLGSSSTITGTGYIKTNGHEIIISKSIIPITDPLYFFNDNVVINGTNNTTIDLSTLNGALNFQQVANVTFRNIGLFVSSPATRLIFPAAKLTALNFFNTALTFFSDSTLTVGANNLTMEGNCTFSGKGATLIVPVSLEVIPPGNFELMDFVTIRVAALDIGGVESIFSLNNLSTLHFTQATTGIVGNGRIFIKGKASFTGTNALVNMTANQDLVIAAGARLTLNGVRLKHN